MPEPRGRQVALADDPRRSGAAARPCRLEGGALDQARRLAADWRSAGMRVGLVERGREHGWPEGYELSIQGAAVAVAYTCRCWRRPGRPPSSGVAWTLEVSSRRQDGPATVYGVAAASGHDEAWGQVRAALAGAHRLHPDLGAALAAFAPPRGRAAMSAGRRRALAAVAAALVLAATAPAAGPDEATTAAVPTGAGAPAPDGRSLADGGLPGVAAGAEAASGPPAEETPAPPAAAAGIVRARADPARPGTAGAPPAGRGRYAVHVASVRDPTRVPDEWGRLARRHPGLAGLALRPPQPVDVPGKGTFYRVLAGAFATLAEAEAACGAIRAEGAACAPVAP